MDLLVIFWIIKLHITGYIHSHNVFDNCTLHNESIFLCQVNDGQFHSLEILIRGKNLTMVVDGGLSQTIINEGQNDNLDLAEPLYLGGIPADVKDNAFKKWHIRHTDSFGGRKSWLGAPQMASG